MPRWKTPVQRMEDPGSGLGAPFNADKHPTLTRHAADPGLSQRRSAAKRRRRTVLTTSLPPCHHLPLTLTSLSSLPYSFSPNSSSYSSTFINFHFLSFFSPKTRLNECSPRVIDSSHHREINPDSTFAIDPSKIYHSRFSFLTRSHKLSSLLVPFASTIPQRIARLTPVKNLYHTLASFCPTFPPT